MRKYSLWRLAWLLLFLTITIGAFAQRADFVERYASRDAVPGDETVFLLALATGRLPADARFTAEAVDQATIPDARALATSAPLTLGELSFLIARYLEVQPGLMGRLLPGPRYALRDLRNERIVLYEANAGAPVPGEVALRTIRRAVVWSAERGAGGRS